MNDKIIAGYDDIKLELWLRNREKNKIVWKTKNGNLISIKEISDEHLENIINHLESTDIIDDNCFKL